MSSGSVLWVRSRSTMRTTRGSRKSGRNGLRRAADSRGIGNDLLRIWPATDREATHDRRSQVQVLPPHRADRLLRDRDSIFRWLGSPLCQRIANARAAQRRLEARAASEEPSCQAC